MSGLGHKILKMLVNRINGIQSDSYDPTGDILSTGFFPELDFCELVLRSVRESSFSAQICPCRSPQIDLDPLAAPPTNAPQKLAGSRRVGRAAGAIEWLKRRVSF
jgi:hypothetical protein